ncbi:Probable dolichyl pyrophosphate Man9GlcNAc2 alpha-1,3-glucosyltransferase [Galdieria sulphuraria]|nr:Probable dolichyl pyrophosphate Man9GlcNAc2 alpha-1,3-glucosyltransferase [Galdieria sulphuraria]
MENKEQLQTVPWCWSDASFKQKLLFSFGFVVLLRLLVSLSPYSGQATPPLYGDLEAQRHWMEITLSLPPAEWYRQTADNDLKYWGIDYPPLSAYYSWVCETESSKCLLRLSVILSDVLFLLPACLQLCLRLNRKGENETLWLFVTTTSEPCLLLVDHGHFQYNGANCEVASLQLLTDEFFKDVCASVNLLLKAHPNATKFVFHCQLSKVRGPSCAKLFREETATNHRNRAQNTEVFLLEGGFQAFCYKYVSQVRWGHFGNDFLSYQLCVTESYRINS